jgi:CMP/dCMP kinase
LSSKINIEIFCDYIKRGGHMKKIICLSGDLYSGKSTAGKIIAKNFGYEYFSAGSIFRNIAQEKGVNVLELNNISEKDDSIDKLIDSKIERLGRERENIILDSRMAWSIVKEGFKVYLTIDINAAAERALKDKTRETERYESIEEAIRSICERTEDEVNRYSVKYGVDICRQDNYDLVIDTTTMTPEEVAEAIVKGYQEFLR